MSGVSRPNAGAGDELQMLRERIEELESTLEAIRTGEVDALITTGKEGERVFTLRSADQPYRILVEAMNEGAALLAPDGQILYCNSRLAQMLDHPVERISGRLLPDFIAADDREACADLLRRSVGRPYSGELWLARPGGHRLPVLLSASRAIVDEEVCICLVATDLTARHKSEQVMASERLAYSILEQTPAAIVVCDAEGCIIRANSKSREHNAGIKAGEHLDTVLALRLTTGVLFSIASVLKGETLTSVEGGLHLGGGGSLPVLLTAGPLTNVDGRVIGAVVTITDISERKAAEEKLRDQAAALARSNADLERVAFAASHDLQEPLRMVTTYTQLLTRHFRGAVGPDAEFFATYVERGAERMRKLVLDLLSYSRVIHNPDLDFTIIDMNAVAAGATATEDMQKLIEESKADVRVDELPAVRGSASHVSQIFENLIGNAIKYARREGVRVQVSAEPGTDMHTFTVADDGPGIDPQYHDQVFGLFKRLHGSKVPGSGMGLALCRRIADLHGGRIWVESAPGNGARFRFTLPAARV